MICPICGETKPDYHFFKHRNKYDKTFFANGIPKVDICWACGSSYKCVGCQQVKPHTEFRVGGRFCVDCRTAGISNLQVLNRG
jgi:hypothetical protein